MYVAMQSCSPPTLCHATLPARYNRNLHGGSGASSEHTSLIRCVCVGGFLPKEVEEKLNQFQSDTSLLSVYEVCQ